MTKKGRGLLLGLAASIMLLPGVAAAQINDPRVLQMEEQMRQMRGQIEELNFLMLQMQEQMRRQQEDNEFRLQQLEDQQQGSAQPAAPAPGSNQVAANPPPAVTTPTQDRPTAGTAPPPGNLGTISVDGQGNVTGSDIDFSSVGVNSSDPGGPIGSVSGQMNAEELYRTGYEHVLNGDYALAEEIFKRFVALYPNDVLAPDARFWLGESVLAQGRFQDAADIFIDNRTRHPQSGKAAETMLKIGTIMAALGNRDVACVTFADALANHPNMNANVRQRIEGERAEARC